MPKQVDFDQILKNVETMKSRLPRILARQMLNHSKQAFRNQGFTDKTLDPWKSRKRPNKADRNNPRTRAILIDSGALRRSLMKKKATFREIRIGSYGIPYASRHNRGLHGMPQRQFIGHSAKLNKKLSNSITKEIKKVFKT